MAFKAPPGKPTHKQKLRTEPVRVAGPFCGAAVSRSGGRMVGAKRVGRPECERPAARKKRELALRTSAFRAPRKLRGPARSSRYDDPVHQHRGRTRRFPISTSRQSSKKKAASPRWFVERGLVGDYQIGATAGGLTPNIHGVEEDNRDSGYDRDGSPAL
jgi:hypothetical protein